MPFHYDLTDEDLHAVGYIDSTDPATTYGTAGTVASPGVRAGQAWVFESSADVANALKYRNAGNDGWNTIIPALTQGDLLYTDADPDLATLSIGSQHDVLVVDGASAPEWKSGLTDDNIAAAAEIAVAKLADGTARQLLQTDAAGTGVEWTSNVDVPGTLDVTGAVTLDSTLSMVGNADLADDVQLQFGAAPDYWFVYDATGTQFRFRSTDVGAGADGDIFTVQDGAQLVAFAGALSTSGDMTSGGGVSASGELTVSGTGTSRIDGLLEVGGNHSAGHVISVLAQGSGQGLGLRNAGDSRNIVQFDGSGTDEDGRVLLRDSGGTIHFNASASGLSTTSAATLDTGANGSSFGGDLTVTGDLTVSGAGPHAIGSSAAAFAFLRLAGSHTSTSGGSTQTVFSSNIIYTANAGATTEVSGFRLTNNLTTQGNSETINDVAQAVFVEPDITVGTGDTVTNASTVKINSAPTEGSTNRAFWVATGLTELGGDFQHSGTNLGLYSATPVSQPTTGIGEAAFVENSGGTAVNVDSTFGGYTLQQIVQALQDIGALA